MNTEKCPHCLATTTRTMRPICPRCYREWRRRREMEAVVILGEIDRQIVAERERGKLGD